MKKNYITTQILKSFETEDDLAAQNEIKVLGITEDDYYDSDEFTEHIQPGSVGESITEPLPISMLENFVGEAKRLGATHIGLEFHVDHGGYIVDFVKMTKSTDEEIAEYEKKAADAIKAHSRIAELEEELRIEKAKQA